MKLDITVIKNETLLKFQKAMKSTKDKFHDMLSIALDAAIHEIDQDKRQEVGMTVNDMINDEFNRYLTAFTKCMNKASEIIQNELETERG